MNVLAQCIQHICYLPHFRQHSLGHFRQHSHRPKRQQSHQMQHTFFRNQNKVITMRSIKNIAPNQNVGHSNMSKGEYSSTARVPFGLLACFVWAACHAWDEGSSLVCCGGSGSGPAGSQNPSACHIKPSTNINIPKAIPATYTVLAILSQNAFASTRPVCL